MYEEFLKLIENKEIITVNEYIEEYPSFYRFVKKARLVKLHKGVYAKNVMKKNVITNKLVSYTEINKTEIFIDAYTDYIVATNLTLNNKLHFTTQVSMKKEYILIDKIKFKNIDNNTKFYYNNTKLNSKDELFYYNVIKCLYVDYELNREEVIKFLKYNKKFYDKYLTTYINNNKSNRILYTLAYIYKNIFNEVDVSDKIQSSINKSSSFKLPKVFEEKYV